MNITMLGTGAPLHPSRAMTGLIVTAPDCAPLLIDTCGGFELARQLKLVGFDRTKIRAVIVTHRHLDHSGGVQELLLARMPLDIYASRDTHDGIAEVTAGSFPEWPLHSDVKRYEVRAGTSCDIVGFRIDFFAAVHRVPTVAIRVSHGAKVFAFSADTIASDDVVACARNSDLFLCDTLCAELDGEDAVESARWSMHLTAKEGALIADRAGAGALACTHLARFADPENVSSEAQSHFSGRVTVSQDGDVYCL
jgi:ribonuclease BN (tRNA processing enzyme)